MNEDITAPQVRVIGSDGEQIGVIPISEAQQAAYDKELDLVEIVPNAEPPVCRIMDHGKFLFEENKKRHAAKKKTKASSSKGNQVSTRDGYRRLSGKTTQPDTFPKRGRPGKSYLAFPWERNGSPGARP
jgi:translation initiation factor IF-3